ncbi:MAG: hypothetical protein ACK56I_22070, partial [bacterium]
LGSHLRVHIYITGARGSCRVVLHRVLPDGREEIHGAAWSTEEIPVRPGNPAGSSLQAIGYLGLDGGP